MNNTPFPPKFYLEQRNGHSSCSLWSKRECSNPLGTVVWDCEDILVIPICHWQRPYEINAKVMPRRLHFNRMELWPYLVKLAGVCSLAKIAQLHLINRMQKISSNYTCCAKLSSHLQIPLHLCRDQASSIFQKSCRRSLCDQDVLQWGHCDRSWGCALAVYN